MVSHCFGEVSEAGLEEWISIGLTDSEHVDTEPLYRSA